jgi:hypothetical protein
MKVFIEINGASQTLKVGRLPEDLSMRLRAVGKKIEEDDSGYHLVGTFANTKSCYLVISPKESLPVITPQELFPSVVEFVKEELS